MPRTQPFVMPSCVADGLLSDAQLETLIYATNAFERDLPGKYLPHDNGCTLQPHADGAVYRCGYFLGDGTGAGKGRQVAAIFLDRWLRGELSRGLFFRGASSVPFGTAIRPARELIDYMLTGRMPAALAEAAAPH